MKVPVIILYPIIWTSRDITAVLFVFNIAGQRVAQIANHELLGLTGKLTWDGYALSGRQLQTGVYIFYAELYHTSGTVKRYKQVFLVR